MQQGQRPEANQPGQRLGNGNKTDEAQKGRVKVVPSNGKVVPPFQAGFTHQNYSVADSVGERPLRGAKRLKSNV